MLRTLCLALALLAPLLALLLAPLAARAELRGHGGPVRALAVSADGRLAMSGSFDQSAILWDVEGGAALGVLRFHDGAVNAVAGLPDGRFATGGEDGRIAIWRLGGLEPEQVIEGHKGPVVGLAVSPDGTALASASWDGTARVTPLAGPGAGLPDGAARAPSPDGSAAPRPDATARAAPPAGARVIEGHQGQVNAVAFLPDGRIATGGYDATLRIWPGDGGAPAIRQLPTPLNAVAVAPDGEIVTAGADGMVRILTPDGSLRAEAETEARPIIALALSPDGTRIAAATVGGSVAVLDRGRARLLFRLVGPGLPVWSLAFRPDGAELLTGGGDRLVRRWDMRTGEHIGAVVIARPEDVLAGFRGERGAEVFQACAACHTLTPDGGNRAGPTLHGVFGRRIATAPGYNFSPALKGLDIVWNAETIAKLFEVGPAQYTPGTKMPEQQIGSAADREALVRFLERATR